ncbi:sulfatase-like hydrolase/transferase [Phototrophicus methaneseepsis]|uniref:Sulfatase-like hydrolase/transferase n=1 Tax=Phototrophicus methaneseepsis TaxID=2710758 RepID=A0A7S8EBR2_9CHLR|nr:sulfatase-like hydrolase/transferase [Phototrophicus methaneseepsis]QPC84021.1 sulfatase-like hydrolase/transferase [Phototrophicus methaneseepsis]
MTKLNVLLITSDQQHWNTLGSLNPEIQTPHLDKLADEGTLFTRAYCPNPTCTPTRACLITGKYPSQNGAYSLGTKLPEDEPTVGERFKEAGYQTALVGKAHFQPLRGTEEFPSLESYPLLQDFTFWQDFEGPFYGFDHVELTRNHTDEAHVGQHYVLWMEEKGLTNWRDYFRSPTGNNDSQRRKWLIPEEYHYNAWIAERTNALISDFKEKDEPFFMWASFFDPHPDYLVPEPWDTMYDPESITVPQVVPGEHDKNPPAHQMTQQENPDFSGWEEINGNAMHGYHSHLHDRDELAKNIATYYGMISCMDKYIGRIVDHLDALGLAENTLVVFTSDHGHYFGQHGLIAKGAFHYDDGIKVPMIARLPGQIPAGQRSDTLQTLVDYAPTFLGYCGLDIPDDMTGHNQQAIWNGDSTIGRQHVIVENRHQPTTLYLKTYIDDRYKLTVYYNRAYGELFDLKADPNELNNLWQDEPELRAALMEKFLTAEMLKEEPLSDAAKARPNKTASMYIKSYNSGPYQMNYHPQEARYELFNLITDPAKTVNLWDDADYADIRAKMVQALLFGRMGMEPVWMPRVAGA